MLNCPSGGEITLQLNLLIFDGISMNFNQTIIKY